MKVIFGSILILLLCSNSDLNSKFELIVPICNCDSSQVRSIIRQKEFNRIPEYDTSDFKQLDFYSLDSSINRMLWYRDIENPDTTKFTALWNSYGSENYLASHLDFIDYYLNRENIELAFQLGPNNDLWAYHTFVIKKVNSCYLATHSYFRHARFTFKSYSILHGCQVDSLFKTINNLSITPILVNPEHSYSAYFADNRTHKSYFINLERESKIDSSKSSKDIKAFYEFLNVRINWIQTYNL